MKTLECGIDIHDKVVENGISSKVMGVNYMININAKYGTLHQAISSSTKSAVSWTIMVGRYAIQGCSKKDPIKIISSNGAHGRKPCIIIFII